MKNNFAKCLEFTLKYEGGYVDHPSDPGGATNMGITHITLSRIRGYTVTKAEVKALTLNEVSDIYKSQYWDIIEGNTLELGVDLVAFDLAVNSGIKKALRYLAEAKAVTKNPVKLIKDICAKRLFFLHGLTTFKVFGKGWTARVNACEVAALKMATSSPLTKLSK